VSIVPNDRDGLVRVIAFGRISFFGRGATRLHDQVLSVAAQWLESRAEGHLRPFADQADRRAISTLEELLADPARLEPVPEHVQNRVLENAASDFATLWPAVKAEAQAKPHEAQQKLTHRGAAATRAGRLGLPVANDASVAGGWGSASRRLSLRAHVLPHVERFPFQSGVFA
jgi:hypothetical protein